MCWGGMREQPWDVEAGLLGYVKKREKHKKPLTRNGNKPVRRKEEGERAERERWRLEEEGKGTDRMRVWEERKVREGNHTC